MLDGICAQSVSSSVSSLPDSVSYDSSLWLLEPVPLSVSVHVCVIIFMTIILCVVMIIPDMEESGVEGRWLDKGVSSLDSCSNCCIDLWRALLTTHEDTRSSA